MQMNTVQHFENQLFCHYCKITSIRDDSAQDQVHPQLYTLSEKWQFGDMTNDI